MKAAVLLAAVAVSLFTAATARAAGPFGPPEPEAKEDSLSVGIGYFRNAMTWSPKGGNGDISITQEQAYLQGGAHGMGFSGESASYLRIGTATFDDGKGFKGGSAGYGGLVTRDVWYNPERWPDIKVGTIVQANLYLPFRGERRSASGTALRADVSRIFDFSVAAAVQKALRENIVVYGGPVLYYGTGKAKFTEGGPAGSVDFTEKGFAGAMGGARVSLTNRLTLGAEVQFRSAVSAGAWLAYAP